MADRLFKISFLSDRGCPEEIMQDMLRHDRMRIVMSRKDITGRYLAVIVRQEYGSELMPSADRWATFLLGACIEEIILEEDEGSG